MTFTRVPYLLVGAAAALGSALWLDGIIPPIELTAASSAAWTIIQALVVLATAVLAMLATAAGALVTSDWQAELQSRQAWAQLGLTLAELSLPVDPETAGYIDPRYPASLDNEALQQVLRAHLFALPVAVDHGIADAPAGACVRRIVLPSAEPSPARSTRDAAPKSVRDQENTTGKLSETDISGRALGKFIDTGAIGVSQLPRSHRAAKFHVKRGASRPRLVANSHAWFGWLARDARIPASYTADVIVLSRRDDQTQQLPDAFVGPNSSETRAPPSCRGPPQVIARRPRTAGTTSAKRSAENAPHVPRAGALPAADNVVRDNLGQPVPVCAAELDVIEAYLGQVLQDLIAPSTSDSEPGQA